MIKTIAIFFVCLTLSGCGFTKFIESGSYGRNSYDAPPGENSITLALQYLDTWANYYTIEYVVKVGDDIFEIDVYKRGKRIAQGYGSKEQAKEIIDFLSDWLQDEY